VGYVGICSGIIIRAYLGRCCPKKLTVMIQEVLFLKDYKSILRSTIQVVRSYKAKEQKSRL